MSTVGSKAHELTDEAFDLLCQFVFDLEVPGHLGHVHVVSGSESGCAV
jgi:hypothetical protein